MKLIGYLFVRETDSIKYPIYENYENSYYYIFNDRKYNINNLNLSQNTVIFLSKSTYYKDFEKDCKNKFEFIYVNNEKIKNENYIEIPVFKF